MDELREQGARTVAFDVLFSDLRADHPQVQMADGDIMGSDEFFARQLHQADNVILGDTGDAPLPELFATNAFAIGDITSEKDSDGVLRPGQSLPHLSSLASRVFEQAADEFGLDLDNAKVIQPGKIILPQTGTTNTVVVPIDASNNFQMSDFVGPNLPPGMPPTAKAFTDERVWQMGIVLAAQQLKLDLTNADVDLPHGKIVLHGENGVERTMPVDASGYFYVDWQITINDPRILRAPIENLLAQNYRRLNGETNGFTDDFREKVVLVGSTAQGNDLSDRGATPLSREAFLTSKYLNVANSIIMDQFIRRASPQAELGIAFLLGILTVVLTLELPAFSALGASFSLAAVYTMVSFFVFIRFRLWLPLVFPVVGSIFGEHIVLVAYRVLFEETEKRRVKSVFSKIVAPEIVNELLQEGKTISRRRLREVTVYFADVRGFHRIYRSKPEYGAGIYPAAQPFRRGSPKALSMKRPAKP